MFEDPVTEAIAPGYFDTISMPMDYSTVESRLEKRHYKNREEVRGGGREGGGGGWEGREGGGEGGREGGGLGRGGQALTICNS